MRATIGGLLALAALAAAQVRLDTGKPEHRRIEGAPDFLTVDLKIGEYIEILAEQTSVDVVLRLAGPDGKQIQEVNHLGIGGTELMIQLTDSPGVYKLEARPSRDGQAGDYVVTLAVRRMANEKDREVAEMDARFRQLLAANSPDSVTQMEEIAVTLGRLGVPRREAAALRAAGVLNILKYQWEGAIKDGNDALARWRAIHDPAGENAALMSLGLAYYSDGQSEKAIPIYEEALVIARQVRNRDGEGKTLGSLGNVRYQMRELEAAIGYWEQALPIFRELKNVPAEATTLSNLGLAYSLLGQTEKAISYYERGLASARDARDRAGEARALDNLGIAYGNLSQFETAIDYEEQSLAIVREIKDRARETGVLRSLGSHYSSEGQFEKAVGYYEQALTIAREVEDKFGQAGALANLAEAHSHMSHFEKAISYNEQALKIFRDVKDPLGEAVTLDNFGNVYFEMGQYAKAAGYHEQSLKIRRDVKDRAGEAGTLMRLANVHTEAREYATAIGFYEQSLAIRREVKDRSGEAVTLDNLGATYALAGEQEKAIGAINQSVAIAREIGARDVESGALNSLADLSLQRGELETALAYRQEALMIARELKSRETEATALDGIMQVNLVLGQPRLAAFYGKQSVNVIQSIRADIRALPEESRKSFLESHRETYRRLADILVSQGRLVEAHQVLNLLKEQEFYDYVRRNAREAGRSGRADLTAEESEWAERYRGASEMLVAKGAQMEELRERIRKQPALGDSPDTQAKLAELQKDLESGNRAFQQFLVGLKQHFAAKPESGWATVDLRDTEALKSDLADLKHGSVAIYTLVTPERYVAILITPRVQRAYETKIKAAELNKKINAFREAIVDPESDPLPMAKELYRILIPEALAEDLRQARAVTLMWSLDGPLRYVPVAALHDGKQYLIEKYRTAVFTPASNARLKEPPRTRWRGVAFGVTEAHPGFEALPAVSDELRSIVREKPGEPGVLDGKRLMDAQFTRASLDRELALEYPVVHVASHFQFRPGDETQSFLLLGDGGQLTMADLKVADTIFAGVDLLTLSACSTGLGDVGNSDGSEVEGFGVLAQIKGAKAVIASLWPVADQSTGLLMRELYRARESAASMTKVEALRHAQLRLLRGEIKPDDAEFGRGVRGPSPPVRARDYRHPYYWAPFFLMGNWL